jgi:hypothetical protein
LDDIKRKKRTVKKEDHFFDFRDEMKEEGLVEAIDEEGLGCR